MLLDQFGNPVATGQPLYIDEAEPSFLNGPDGELIIRKDQHISDLLLDGIKDARYEASTRREGELMAVAVIPTIIVEEWLRQGYDYREHTAKEIVKRLKEHNLDAFLLTDKRV